MATALMKPGRQTRADSPGQRHRPGLGNRAGAIGRPAHKIRWRRLRSTESGWAAPGGEKSWSAAPRAKGRRQSAGDLLGPSLERRLNSFLAPLRSALSLEFYRRSPLRCDLRLL